jgi:hypothetical protein
VAGDWIKMEKATARKPEVLQLADLLAIHPDHALGLCFRFWSWCDDQMTSGHAPSVTSVTLDSVFGHAGFASALITVGWLRVREGSLEVPNFDRHLSDSAKNRALSGERKKKQRAGVTELSRNNRDKSVTREEKRREEVSISVSDAPDEIVIPLKMQTEEVQKAFTHWVRHLESKDPLKVPPKNSPQLEAFWFQWSKRGPERFCEAVYHSSGNGYLNLHEPPPVAQNGSRATNGKQRTSIDDIEL